MGLYIGKVDRRWLSRVLLIMLADITGIMGSYLLALWARFDFHFTDIPQEFVDGYLHTIWWWVPVCLAVFWLCNLYNSIWRFVSVDALMRIILAYVLLGGLSFACVALFGVHMPRSYYVWGLFFSFFCTSGIRFFYRGMRYLRNRAPLARKNAENVMIIGAGQAGRQLIREYAVSSHLNSRVACIIDDNPAKRGRILEGVRGGTFPRLPGNSILTRSCSPFRRFRAPEGRRSSIYAAPPAARSRWCRACISWSTVRSPSASSAGWSCRTCWAGTPSR